MERCGPAGGANLGGLTTGEHEGEVVVPANFVLHAEASVEVDEIGATTEQDVLAVVDDFASSRMLIRRCPSAEIRATLEQGDAIANFGERAGSGETGEAAAYDGNGCGGTGIGNKWRGLGKR